MKNKTAISSWFSNIRFCGPKVAPGMWLPGLDIIKGFKIIRIIAEMEGKTVCCVRANKIPLDLIISGLDNLLVYW